VARYTEVAYALKVIQQHEIRQAAGRTIEAEAREVGK